MKVVSKTLPNLSVLLISVSTKRVVFMDRMWKCRYCGFNDSIPWCKCGAAINKAASAAVPRASARCLKNIAAATAPGPTCGSGRYAPDRGCQRSWLGLRRRYAKRTQRIAESFAYPEPGSNRHILSDIGVWDQRVYRFRHPGLVWSRYAIDLFWGLQRYRFSVIKQNFLFIFAPA